MTPERLQEIRDHASKHAHFYPGRERGTVAAKEREELLGYVDTLHALIAALRRGQGPAPREPGPINITPIPDSRRTP